MIVRKLRLAASVTAVGLLAPLLPLAGAAGAEPPPEVTIAEIQGTGATSPYAGDRVVTEGVVTAQYETGGFDGFYLQTEGTGGDVDPTEKSASQAVFVYAPDVVQQVETGDAVAVTGRVSEYQGLTELSVSGPDSITPTKPAKPVKPASVAYPRTDAQRERLEGMLLDPQGAYTVTDNYETNYYGSVGLAAGTEPLVQPTEVADPHDEAAVAKVERDNRARAVTLDDGASTNFSRPSNTDIALPYLSAGGQVRTGAYARFHRPVILDYRYGAWSFQPTEHLTADNAPRVQPARFAKTRTKSPERARGDVRLASFNVLNYFTTTGAEWGCDSYYDDREGNHITVDDCGEEGPRGAADAENLQRQQAKITAAINDLDADVVSLEEIENSVKFGKDRDAALADLVSALNEAAGKEVWAYAASPDAADLPPTAEQDVIRTAFIYDKRAVEAVGESRVLVGSEPFGNAREPLAQAFRPRGASRRETFIAIVNHFKSKGSGVDDGTGQGNANPDRIKQARALVDFAGAMKTELGSDRVFLTGDFNAYTKEDPLRVLAEAGYTDLASTLTGEQTYVYDGKVGSLDHILASPAARGSVRGADVWNINAYEPVAYEYSRYNYNVLDLYDESPYRSSDHDPILVGIDAGCERHGPRDG